MGTEQSTAQAAQHMAWWMCRLGWESQEDAFLDELIADNGVGSEAELGREIL